MIPDERLQAGAQPVHVNEVRQELVRSLHVGERRVETSLEVGVNGRLPLPHEIAIGLRRHANLTGEGVDRVHRDQEVEPLDGLIPLQRRRDKRRDPDDLIRHLAGGALMGFGGVLALGCTIGQGISGLSTLALGSILAFFSIIAGAALTMKIQYRRMMKST